METTRIGIIGLGGIAQVVHLPILSKLRNVRIEAAAEIHDKNLAVISKKYGIKNTAKDYTQLLESNEIDAFIIATPTNTHKKIAIDCLEHGKHILIEKPAAPTLNEVMEIAEIAEEKKLTVQVGMNMRFRPDSMLLKSIINSKELGDPYYIRCKWNKKYSSEKRWFFKKKEAGGGVLVDLGISLLDLALWIYDYPEIDTVTAQNYKNLTEDVEDTSIGIIRLKNGKAISYEAKWTNDTKLDELDVAVHCTNGKAQLDPLNAFKFAKSTIMDLSPGFFNRSKSLFLKSYENELKHFIGAVRGEYEPSSSIREAVSRMHLIESIYKSAENKSEIKL